MDRLTRRKETPRLPAHLPGPMDQSRRKDNVVRVRPGRPLQPGPVHVEDSTVTARRRSSRTCRLRLEGYSRSQERERTSAGQVKVVGENNSMRRGLSKTSDSAM